MTCLCPENGLPVSIPLGPGEKLTIKVTARVKAEQNKIEVFGGNSKICALKTASQKAKQQADEYGHAVFSVFCGECGYHLFLETDIPTT